MSNQPDDQDDGAMGCYSFLVAERYDMKHSPRLKDKAKLKQELWDPTQM